MITFVLLSISVNAQWTQTSGPGGGIAKIIKVTPDGKFIVGSYGGIFLSADSGQTWVSSNTGIVKNAEIVDIDIVGSDIYIATSSSYFYNSYKSTNNGATWTEVFPSANFFVPFSITHIGNRVMISSVNEIKYSDDAGATWDTVSTYLLSPDSTGQPNISLVNVIDNVLWVGAWNMGLCKSIDSGATWVHADGGLDPTNPPAQIVSTGTALFVSIPYNQSVYTSTNNGATWTTVTFPNPAGNAAYVYNDNTDIYILSNPSIYKSTNNGSTWTTFSGSLIGYYIAMGNIGTSFLTSLNMYPTSLQRSVNSGATWVNANYGFASTRVESVLADGNNLYASSYETETYISSDSGNTYTQIPDGTFTYAIDMIKVGNEIVQGGYHFHYHTSNNGANWVSFSAGMPPTSTLSQYCLDGNDLYAATDAGLFKSVNFGTWTLVGASLPNANILNVNSVVKLGNRLFIAGDSASLATFEYFGVCYYSDDNGLTWTNFSAQFPFTAYTQGGKMFVVGNTIFMNAAAQVYSSTNNGLTWNLIGTGLPTYVNISDYYYDGTRLYITTGGGVYASADMGQNFTDITENLYNNNVHSITMMNGFLYIGTEWGGVWKYDASLITVGIPRSNSIQNTINIYPNPTADNFTMLVSSGKGNVKIISSSGELVYDENILSSKWQINTNDFKAGIYFVQLMEGDVRKTSKLIITK